LRAAGIYVQLQTRRRQAVRGDELAPSRYRFHQLDARLGPGLSPLGPGDQKLHGDHHPDRGWRRKLDRPGRRRQRATARCWLRRRQPRVGGGVQRHDPPHHRWR
jgi:hypothetical protein